MDISQQFKRISRHRVTGALGRLGCRVAQRLRCAAVVESEDLSGGTQYYFAKQVVRKRGFHGWTFHRGWAAGKGAIWSGSPSGRLATC